MDCSVNSDESLSLPGRLEPSGCRSPITTGLQIHINHLAILIDGLPQIMLLTIDLDEDFIDEEGIAVASMLSFQSSSV